MEQKKVYVRWTEQEDMFLDALIGTMPFNDVVKQLNKKNGFIRSRASVKNRVNRRHLSVIPQVNNWSAAQLSRLLGLQERAVFRWVERGLIKTRKDGVKHVINKKSLRDFCLNYPSIAAVVDEDKLAWALDDTALAKQVKQHPVDFFSSKPKKVRRKDGNKIYLSIHEAARALNVSRFWVRSEIKKPDGWLELVS